jgi:hypothetical protein
MGFLVSGNLDEPDAVAVSGDEAGAPIGEGAAVG